jgi:hypothetical protein
VAAAEEREESKPVEQEGDHRAEVLSGSGLTDQLLTGTYRPDRVLAKDKAGEDEGDHAGHHRSGRLKVNVDKADRLNRRHRAVALLPPRSLSGGGAFGHYGMPGGPDCREAGGSRDRSGSPTGMPRPRPGPRARRAAARAGRTGRWTGVVVRRARGGPPPSQWSWGAGQRIPKWIRR